jgi:plasmid stabilization system protein ParE
MDLFLSGPAVADLEAISEHALATQPSQAHGLISQLKSSLAHLAAQYDLRHQAKTPLEEIGRILSGRFAIHYETKDKKLIISRILPRHMPLMELS